ncbi:conserved hypothetical protein [Micromonospora lupini str. Lupac 08]|uniref:ATP/GTP-binding protein n=1 Tax=Micromonospora lupini str. Lupac 08 TaxID=1150864 RepID=I0L1S0_9ACTN|nr:conserved hypothetical protein [Micromonospora lupini str. Lupac 08]
MDCSLTPDVPECSVEVGTPPSTGDGNSGGEHNGGSNTGGGSGGEHEGADGCRYIVIGRDDPPAGARQPGAWYSRHCINDGGASERLPVWIADAQSPDPAVLARSAISRLDLPVPAIRANPAPPAAQLLNVPTWLWLEGPSYRARSATASVPGLSVTATASPSKVRWSTGDGASFTCSGAGTPWRAGMDPAVASSCSHTYKVPSNGQPGGVYEVRATVTWEIGWVGGGTSGSVDPVTTTATVPLRVQRSSALNGAG